MFYIRHSYTSTLIKVCLKCGKVVDRSTKRKQKEEKLKKEKQSRHELAMKIYNKKKYMMDRDYD